jgi:hypothetical protein
MPSGCSCDGLPTNKAGEFGSEFWFWISSLDPHCLFDPIAELSAEKRLAERLFENGSGGLAHRRFAQSADGGEGDISILRLLVFDELAI